MPTWAAIPPATITPPSSPVAVTLSSAGTAANTAAITASEVDYYRVTPATSGGYRLTATRTGAGSLSPLQNPVLALFDATGKRIAYNNDQSVITDTNSTIELAHLTAGQRYYFGITNLTGTASGGYLWTVSRATASDDASENNDTFASATKLGLLTQQTRLSDRVLMDAADYYQFSMEGYGSATSDVSINFDNGQGDLNLTLYNAAGIALASRSSTSANVETISLANRAPGIYSLRVNGANGAWNPRYSLNINPGVDDGFENNDTMATAYDLGTLGGVRTMSNLQLVDNGDYYRFTMDGIGDVNDYVRINFQNAQGNLDLMLYDTHGVKINSSVSTANEERISLNNLNPGVYHVYVYRSSGAFSPNYTLEIAPALDDAFENNDTMAQAHNLGLLTAPYVAADLVMADGEDWYRFTMEGIGASDDEVRILGDSQAHLGGWLYDATGDLKAGNWGSVSLEHFLPGTYYVRVTGSLQPSYSLQITPGLDDFAENNDSITNAYDLGVSPTTVTGLQLADAADWYRFTMTGFGIARTHNIRLDGGNPYIRLSMYDGAGGLVPVIQLVPGESKKLDLGGLTPGSYYLKIDSPTGDLASGYNLAFNLPTEDPYEDNDDMAHAVFGNVGDDTRVQMQLVDTEDWFRFSMDYPGNVGTFVEITTISGGGQLQLELFDSDGNVLDTARTDGNRRVSLEGRTPGTYFLRITGVLGATNAYELNVNLFQP